MIIIKQNEDTCNFHMQGMWEDFIIIEIILFCTNMLLQIFYLG